MKIRFVRVFLIFAPFLLGLSVPASYGESSFSELRVKQGDPIKIVSTLEEFDEDTVIKIKISDFENKTILDKVYLPDGGKVAFDYDTKYLDVGNYTVSLKNYDGSTETNLFYVMPDNTDIGPVMPQIYSAEMISSIIVEHLLSVFRIFL